MKHLVILSLLVTVFVACNKKSADDESTKRLAKVCKLADDLDVKGFSDDQMREFMSNHLTACASACDAKDEPSCKSVAKQVSGLCKVSQEVCSALCDPSKPGSITDNACKLKK